MRLVAINPRVDFDVNKYDLYHCKKTKKEDNTHMSRELFFKTFNEILCIRNIKTGEIIQNDASKKICGENDIAKCECRCIPYFNQLEKTELWNRGPILLKDKTIEGSLCDILFVKNGDLIFTFVFPVAVNESTISEMLRDNNATDREVEVALLKIRGKSNQEICEELFISNATLKTHINNFYKKISPELALFIKEHGNYEKLLNSIKDSFNHFQN